MKIISGGQTGVDRAALDVAIERGVPWGGWCPKGGWAEDFPEPPGLLMGALLVGGILGACPRSIRLWR